MKTLWFWVFQKNKIKELAHFKYFKTNIIKERLVLDIQSLQTIANFHEITFCFS
jgi:hypothetical protein